MSKKKLPLGDILIIGALFLIMILWGPIYQAFFPTPPAPAPSAAVTNAVPASAGATNPPAPKPAQLSAPAAPSEPERSDRTPLVAATDTVEKAVAPRSPERTLTIGNAQLSLTLSSYGGAVKTVRVSQYPLTPKTGSPSVVLDYGGTPALCYEGLAGLDGFADFTLTEVSGGVARVEARSPAGLRLVRTISANDRYRVTVQDAFVNTDAAPAKLPAHAVTLGAMRMLEGETAIAGLDLLGIDTLPSTGGEGVRHWVYKRWFSKDLTLADYFQEAPRQGHGCIGRPGMTRPLPHSIRERVDQSMDWASVKNKFFVQILAPVKESADGGDLIVERDVSPFENAADSRTWAEAAVPKHVAAALRFNERQLAPGEGYVRSYSYYVGPKELSTLTALGNHQKEVMDFGSLKWLCEVLVWCLSQLYRLIPNYGVAIILLTLIVRVVFWPLTHKGTESMKKMQALQPKIAEIREKYKDKPQKMQQETMALYKEHKVNPVGGCLPMVIQIPVFFALFNVLRSAIELRYAPFLWVRDLSAPENLFQGMIPVIGSLNILPLVMAATQAWQQKLTPAAGDPAQQKMMMFMPLIMLMFLYSMPSALVLYWTANQVLMIIQLLWQRRASAEKAKT